VDAVELLFEDALRYDPALTPEQVLQNRCFTTRQLQRDARDADVSTNGIEGDIARPQRGTERRSRTAQQRLCSSNELAHYKRLHEIIICPRIQPENSLFHGIPRGENQDRYVISGRTQLSEQVEPIAVGKPKVEDRGIVGGVCQCFPRIAPQPYSVHDKLSSFQRGFDELRNSRFI